MQLDQLYQEIILDHYKHPHGRGLRDVDDPGDRVAEAHHVNPTCGDEVTVRVATDGDVAFAGVARYPARVKCALLPWMAFKDAAARAGVGVSPSEVKA